jgi:hypothetical protein
MQMGWTGTLGRGDRLRVEYSGGREPRLANASLLGFAIANPLGAAHMHIEHEWPIVNGHVPFNHAQLDLDGAFRPRINLWVAPEAGVYYAYYQLDYRRTRGVGSASTEVSWEFRVNGQTVSLSMPNDDPPARGSGRFALSTLLRVEKGDSVGVWCSGCGGVRAEVVVSNAQVGLFLVDAAYFSAINRHSGSAEVGPMRWMGGNAMLPERRLRQNETDAGQHAGTLVADRLLLEREFAYKSQVGLAEASVPGW